MVWPGGIRAGQQDLVPDTTKIASAMERYSPDKTWVRTDDEELSLVTAEFPEELICNAKRTDCLEVDCV